MLVKYRGPFKMFNRCAPFQSFKTFQPFNRFASFKSLGEPKIRKWFHDLNTRLST